MYSLKHYDALHSSILRWYWSCVFLPSSLTLTHPPPPKKADNYVGQRNDFSELCIVNKHDISLTLQILSLAWPFVCQLRYLLISTCFSLHIYHNSEMHKLQRMNKGSNLQRKFQRIGVLVFIWNPLFFSLFVVLFDFFYDVTKFAAGVLHDSFWTKHQHSLSHWNGSRSHADSEILLWNKSYSKCLLKLFAIQ